MWNNFMCWLGRHREYEEFYTVKNSQKIRYCKNCGHKEFFNGESWVDFY